jgi:hypothetical protein
MFFLIKKQQSGPTPSVYGEPIPFEDFVNQITFRSISIPDPDIEDPSATPIDNTAFCTAPDFIEAQIPLWIKQNYSNVEESYLISFLKGYYNWMYCGFKGSQSGLTPYDIEMLFDIDQVPETYLDYYVKTYAPFIELESKNLQRQNLRSFINNIKTKFFSSKGTKASYRYLLKVLFNLDLEKISYPKQGLLRLNGGKFIFEAQSVNPTPLNTGYIEGTITNLPDNINIDSYRGAYAIKAPGLNNGIIQDNNFWQDYSYLLQTSGNTTDAIYYSNTVLQGVHPGGTKVFFEEYVALEPIDFGIIDDNTNDVVTLPTVGELPTIENYLPYYANYNFTTAGVTFCDCCTAYCLGGHYPTYADPRWSDTIPDNTTYFRDITIGDFIKLLPAENSPNTTTTCPVGICSGDDS